MDLKALAIRYSCDKYYAHSYIDFYETLFAGRTVKRLLEVGIGYLELMTPFVPRYVHGASLRMWADFLPEAEIFACDIRPDTLINEGRIHSMVCDQSNLESLTAMLCAYGTSFDVVVDDGSHVTEHQIFTARVLLPVMESGSVYCVEDVSKPEYVAQSIGGVVYRFDKRPDDTIVAVYL